MQKLVYVNQTVFLEQLWFYYVLYICYPQIVTVQSSITENCTCSRSMNKEYYHNIDDHFIYLYLFLYYLPVNLRYAFTFCIYSYCTFLDQGRLLLLRAITASVPWAPVFALSVTKWGGPHGQTSVCKGNFWSLQEGNLKIGNLGAYTRRLQSLERQKETPSP